MPQNKSCNLSHIWNHIFLRNPKYILYFFDPKYTLIFWLPDAASCCRHILWFLCITGPICNRKITIWANTTSLSNVCNRKQSGCHEITAWYVREQGSVWDSSKQLTNTKLFPAQAHKDNQFCSSGQAVHWSSAELQIRREQNLSPSPQVRQGRKGSALLTDLCN